MANALVSFQFEEDPIRVVMLLGDPWFVANDLAKVLGYRDADKLTRLLEDDEKGTHIMGTLGGQQSMNIISESGMYAAVFKSRLPAAVRFRKWVTSEVLPELRRTGKYELAGVEPAGAIASDYDATMLTASIGVVREARRLYGPAAARRVWTQLGLPPGIAASAPDYEGDELAAPLRDWLDGQQAVTISDAIAALDLSPDADIATRRRLGALLSLMGWRSRKARRGHHVVNLWTRLSAGEAAS